MKLNENVTAIVTGGTSGLGLAVAAAFAVRGVSVAVVGREDKKGHAAAAATGALFCKADLINFAEVQIAFDHARSRLGQERILINCAGTSFPTKVAWRDRNSGEMHLHPPTAFDFMFKSNVYSTFNSITCSVAGMINLPLMDNGERAVIINTSSIAATEGQAGQLAYSSSKAAIMGMTLPLARDLADYGVRVNCIMAGVFDTPLMAMLAESPRNKLETAVLVQRRLGRPEEFASLVLEAAQNPYMNGTNIRLDGGLRMPPRA